MSSPEGFPTRGLILRLKTSYRQLVWLILVYAAGLAGVWTNDLLDPVLSLFLSLALSLSCYQFAVKEVLRTAPDAIIGVHFGEQHWHLLMTSGAVVRADLDGPLLTGSHFIVLCFRLPEGMRRLVVIAADAENCATFRRLRVVFRFGGIATVQ